MAKLLKKIVVIGAVGLVLSFAWNIFTDPPSTTDVCYTWSKATDQFLAYSENEIDGAQWLADNLKTEEDLVNIDPDVLSAMKLYDEGYMFEELDPYERNGLRDYVIDACEKSAPGSTKH